jgi:RNA polymerase sigma-70 factor (sigma-E family)
VVLMTTPDIRRDVQRAEPSFDEYVAGRGAVLMRSAWLLTGDRQQAAELVGTALGKAFQHWRRVGEEDGLYDSYVRRTMMTTYLSRWRHRWAPSDLRFMDTAAEVDADAEELGLGALRHSVLEALAVLTRAQRAVVVLRFFEGLTEAQTAEALDCTVAAVRRRTAHALTALGATSLLGAREPTSA